MLKKIGIDFDNTLINYEHIFYDVAVQNALIQTSQFLSKKEVRDHIRRSPNGEILWQKLQADVYGRYINDAQTFAGVIEFLTEGVRRNTKFYIVSHKTPYAIQDIEHKFPLIELAKNWLTQHKIVSNNGPVFPESVFFENTLQKKLNRIDELNCDVFIDDLEEVLIDPLFPNNAQPILFGSALSSKVYSKFEEFESWFDIARYVYGDPNT